MSSCKIDSCCDDGESRTLQQIKCKARQEHVCGECSRIIKKGETYEAYNGVYEDGFFWAKTCLDCLSLRDSFFDGGFMFGAIRDDIAYNINDSGGEVDSSCVVNLTSAAKEFVLATIEEVWNDQY